MTSTPTLIHDTHLHSHPHPPWIMDLLIDIVDLSTHPFREVSHIQEIGDSGDADGDARYANSYNRHFKYSAYTVSNEHLSRDMRHLSQDMHILQGPRLKFSKNKLDERWRCERCSLEMVYAEYLKCLLYDLAYLASPSASPESPISWICDTAVRFSRCLYVRTRRSTKTTMI